MDKALQTVEQILEIDRKPLLAEAVDHVYDNKYELGDRLTNIAIVSQLNVLEKLGLTKSVLQKIDSSKPTTMRFQASKNCTLLKEQIVDVPMEVSREKIEETNSNSPRGIFGGNKKTIERFVKHVKEYHWTVDVQRQLSLFSGTNVDEKIILQSRKASTIVVTQSDQAPITTQEPYHVDPQTA